MREDPIFPDAAFCDLARRTARAMVILMSSKPSSPVRNPNRTPARTDPDPIHPRPISQSGPPPRPVLAGLHIISTPIGDLRDITLRALDTLSGLDLLLAEDTRVTSKLLSAYGLKVKMIAYHDHNGAAVRPRVMAALADGARVGLVSDAGTPLISDPGYKLVETAIAEGHPVFAVPGASALLAGLVVAGLPSDQISFAGFAPSRTHARKRFFEGFSDRDGTLAFYESGPRLAASLADMLVVLGNRSGVVARELTKRHEEVRRGALADLAAHYRQADPPRGEIIVLIGPSEGATEPDADDLDAKLHRAMARLSVKDAADQVSAETGLKRKAVYSRALALKHGDSTGPDDGGR
jgi:16S rRNA (cytidine1402-2'-O)-methyltransferase